jgi:uncharacterized membrane protein YfcA
MVMNGVALPDLAMFLAATFLASAVAGLAGFAFGLVAAALWLHILTPLQTTTLIVVFGLLVQGLAVWRVRHALSIARLWPFLVGAAIGVPVGVALLRGPNRASSVTGRVPCSCFSVSTRRRGRRSPSRRADASRMARLDSGAVCSAAQPG